MNILILGYGFAGFYSARHLIQVGHKLSAVSRQYHANYQLQALNHTSADLNHWALQKYPDVIIYCAPPPTNGPKDTLIKNVLEMLRKQSFTGHFIYWGSSGVYGNHFGHYVTEESHCDITNNIQARRLNAEAQVQQFGKQSNAATTILRVSGLFGRERLPNMNNVLVYREEAPYSNLVFIEDAARLVGEIIKKDQGLGILNVSDGITRKMGDLQRTTAKLKNSPIFENSLQAVLKNASEMKKTFLTSSKKLSIKKLKQAFPHFNFTEFETAIKKCLLENRQH